MAVYSLEIILVMYHVHTLGITLTFVIISPAMPQFINTDVELDIVRPLGTLISLDCSAAAAPSPDYAWTVPQSSQYVNSGPCLDVYFMDSSWEGQYTCNVSNEVGSIQRVFTFRKAGTYAVFTIVYKCMYMYQGFPNGRKICSHFSSIV